MERARRRASPPQALLELHRQSLTTVLVVGGSENGREQVARTFHSLSPVRLGSFVRVDCGRDGARVAQALRIWLGAVEEDPASNPLRAAERGTLYLKCVEALERSCQRLLLTFLRYRQDETLGDGACTWGGRLIAGSRHDLADAVERGRFLGALCDCLDKVRVQLHTRRRGHGAAA